MLRRFLFLHRVSAVILIAALFLSVLFQALTPAVGHAADNGLLQWPFSPADGPWQILQGYNASTSPDHNCNYPNNLYHCYQRYGFDFVTQSGNTGGKTVYSPASGAVIGPWAAYDNEGQCFTVALGSSTGTNTYVMVCHVDFYNGKIASTVTKGQAVGTVDGPANHIHMSIFTSTDNQTAGNPSLRYPLPFTDPWMISGCDYPKDPNDTFSVNGQYSGQAVPCSGQSGIPDLTFQWGSTSWGINLSRPVYVEVRDGLTSADIFSQSVTTNSNGSATLALTGIRPGTYNVLIKPQGFLRQAYPTPVNLAVGSNNLSFSMTNSGTSCTNGQPTGQQLWVGDVNGDNVVNSADYSIIVSYFDKPVPSGYADLDGDGTFTGVDYNMWLRSLCYFGYGQGEVVGDGGRSDTPVNQAAARPQDAIQARRSAHPASAGPGTISLSPASGSYRMNQTFTVNVQGDSAGYLLDGSDLVVHYDPTVLKVTSLTAGTMFAATPALDNNPATGEINISLVANQNQPVAVSGTLATIQFQVVGSGQTNVTLDFNSNSDAHTNMVQDGTVSQVLGSVYSASFTAGILHVPQDYPTIAQALAAANSGETVLVAPGTYHELLTVPAGVILEGQDRNKTIIDGSQTSNTSVISLGNGATVTNLTVQHSGTDFWDAAIWADQGPVTVTNTHILNSSMGIVRFCDAPPCSDTSTIANNLVAHNLATGILIHGAQALVENNTVVGNKLEGITFEAQGGQGTSSNNILTSNNIGLIAPSPTTITSNLFWKNKTNYGSGTTPGSSDILANPLYISTSNYNLHVVSPAVGADGTLGAYPFSPTGKAPTGLKVTQNSSGITFSWHTTNAKGYYVYVAQSSGYFGPPTDVGNVVSYTFTSLPAGSVTFAVASYNGQKKESLAAYIGATIS